jgi:indoleamine 2,3-dioxygenase
LKEMRHYMPRAHRDFLAALENGPAIRPLVTRYAVERPQLTAAFDACIGNLDAFRQKHIEISVRYILHQARESQEAKGTGGTDFVQFLSESRKETQQQRIGEKSSQRTSN